MQATKRGFTIIEVLMVMILIGIVAGWAVTRVNLAGYRVDAAVRMLQNTIIGAQQTAITRGTEVTLRFNRQEHEVETRYMLNGSEQMSARPLPEGARFHIPSEGLGGGAVDFVAGAGAEAVSGQTYLRDVVIAPNGSIVRGDVEIYLTSVSERPVDRRAVSVAGATTRTAFWSFATGSWMRRAY